MRDELQFPTIGVERAVLAGAFLRPEMIPSAASLDPEMFVLEAHREVWRSVLRLADPEPNAVDYLTVEVDLVSRGQISTLPGDWRQHREAESALADRPANGRAPLDRWSPHPFLLALDEHLPDLGRWYRYVSAVVEGWGRRELVRLAHEIQQRPSTDLEGELAKVRLRVEEIQKALPAGSAKTLHSIISEDGDLLSVTGLSSGIRLVDSMLTGGGFPVGGLSIIAGRPGHGKTALALTVARNVAMRGQRVILFSREMSEGENAARLVSQQSGISFESIAEAGGLASWELDRVNKARAEVAKWPISIDELSPNPMAIRRSLEQEIHMGGPVDLVIVDYLQLLEWPKERDTRVEVKRISRYLRMMALELNVPVIALSQLNRGVEMRPKHQRIPVLSDLRESGDIEQDASLVAFVVRQELYEDPGTDAYRESLGKGVVAVRKQRNGPTGIRTLDWSSTRMQFRDPKEEYR